MREDTFTCDACGRKFPADQRQEFGGQELCPDCLMAGSGAVQLE